MDCNKDEAVRAKDIAVRKFAAKDFSGAKKFALKAQTLYPGLEGISQMLTTVNVHISAENKVGGETDLYSVLGVNPLADDDTIKKQYRKLVLQLHPDKNKSIGADHAFLFVTEAFNVLSDKVKRAAYNTRRHIKMAQKVTFQSASPGLASGSRQPTMGRTVDQKLPVPSDGISENPSSGTSPHPPGVNGYSKHPGPTLARGKPQKGGTQKSQSFFKKGDTFWTVCAQCKMQYEYMRVYLGQMLKCPNCEHAFVASEIPPPSNLTPLRAGKPSRGSYSNTGSRVKGVKNSVDSVSARWSPLSGTTAYAQPRKESLKREREKVNSDFASSGAGPSKKIKEMNGNHAGYSGSGLSQKGLMNMETGVGNGNGSSKLLTETERTNAFQGYNVKVNVNRELSATEVKKMLSEMALSDVRNKAKNWKLGIVQSSTSREKLKVKERARQKSRPPKSRREIGSQSVVEAPEFNVPDPDFHVFDHDRLQHCFRENQVWAAYDNDDGMPRFYALIHEVAPSSKFKLKLSWLNSRNNTEFGPLDWVSRGFSKNCGVFWVGKYEPNNLLNCFSHKMKFDKGPRGVIQIYPGEGQIWALYRNWSPDWNRYTPDETRHAYEMVEVLEDYDEVKGVSVAHIIKATGFRTLYYKQTDPKVVKHIPKEEMFRFSHQIPHHILTGNEKPNAPKGFLELDPAATPTELLNMTVPANEEQA